MQYSHYGLVLCAALMAAHSAAQDAPVAAPAASKAAAGTATQRAAQKSALPARKSGLWEVTLRSGELALKRAGQGPQRAQTVQQCTSAEAEPVMLLSIVPGQENCRKISSKRRSKGGGHDIRTVCYVHDNRVEMQMELTGDLQSAYQGVFSVQYAQAPLNNTGRTAFEGRWLGVCKPGQRPGDMVLPNGVTVNVVDDKKRAEGRGHEGHSH